MPGGGGGGKGVVNFPDPWDFDITTIATGQLSSDSTIVSTVTAETNSRIAAETSLTSNSTLRAETILRGDPKTPVTLKLEPVELTTTLKGDPKAPVALTFELLNLPRLTVDDWITLIKTVTTPKVRVHFPVHLNFAFSFFPLNVLGYDAVTFSVCGEQQLITEEYIPNRFERCDVDCEPIECQPISCEPIACDVIET